MPKGRARQPQARPRQVAIGDAARSVGFHQTRDATMRPRSRMAHPRDPGAFARVLLETPFDQRPDRLGHVLGQRVPVGFALENLRDRVGPCGAVERAASCQHFVQHTAKGPDVRSFVDWLSPRLLRTHVGRGADDRADLGRLHGRRGSRLREYLIGRSELRDPEVEHFDVAGRRDLDVGRFEIAVNDPLLVRRGESRRNLAGDRKRVTDSETARSLGPGA